MKLQQSTIIALGGIAAITAGVIIWRGAGAIKQGAIDVVAGGVDMATGVVSGNNAITQAARTDAYQGAGILGTLGAATDIASGGVLSKAGEWLGGKIYDWTH